MSQAANRKHTDFARLMRAGYEVDADPESKNVTQDFSVLFYAPAESPYKGGMYRIHVELPEQYPFQSPSIGFKNRIFHPNIDERSGSVCLDVINQTWTPLYSLVNIFDVFLPQLLAYPNPSDPLNPDAAALMLRDKTAYDCKCQEYVRLYATATALEAVEAEDKGATQGGDEVEENPDPSRLQAGGRSQPMRMAAGSCCSTISSSTTSCQSPTALTPVIRGRETGQDPASSPRGFGGSLETGLPSPLEEMSVDSAPDEILSSAADDAMTVSELSALELDCLDELDLDDL
ncbi:Ubiquitin-conjugating enzyme E2 H [Perkinsus olseni]|uniref:Ubiquitin-conjugating enzyme E2 H n=2 Tax=Perkinsus olseni TaxID=32597 RepID=A0A7J6KUC0_PEROL|nr:Ubiquitin-conjugating enzyme E2 H [Perkinsus olseni]KAF4652523.1 Ubiquitin-conjugating enzyme E2 H [Perkinsus olseni]